MKVVIPGGSGQVGTLLARRLHADGHEVVVLSRRSADLPWRVIPWDGRTPEDAWAAELDGADVLVQLAGRSVNCRYTPENRRAILSSRVDSTRAVGLALSRVRKPPSVWLQASTATIYSHRLDAANNDETGEVSVGAEAPHSWRFSVEVAQAWEATAREACPPGVRLVLMRSAMTMSPDRGGVFATLLGLVRLGLGGAAGSGRQYVSWIHEDDFVAAALWLIAAHHIEGPVILAAPHPLPNREFMRALREAWGIPLGLPAAPWMLEIGAWVMRTETELILKSRRVEPSRLLREGFRFAFPEWPEAARDLCARYRAGR